MREAQSIYSGRQTNVLSVASGIQAVGGSSGGECVSSGWADCCWLRCPPVVSAPYESCECYSPLRMGDGRSLLLIRDFVSTDGAALSIRTRHRVSRYGRPWARQADPAATTFAVDLLVARVAPVDLHDRWSPSASLLLSARPACRGSLY